ncbi:hypothetical protein [Streptomyces sp. NPDC002463]|uniref:hypothetical protein n=1 Tax=Streptomyces sp. NPDC002463 TaxID=3364645 RepID=UPI0036C6B77B
MRLGLRRRVLGVHDVRRAARRARAVGLGLANGPSSVATACVTKEQVGAASGISNMGRYVGSAVLTAVTAALLGSVCTRHHASGTATADALAAGFSRAAIGLAPFCAFGVVLALLAGRFRPSGPPTAAHHAAAAAASSHTVPTSPVNGASDRPPGTAR